MNEECTKRYLDAQMTHEEERELLHVLENKDSLDIDEKVLRLMLQNKATCSVDASDVLEKDESALYDCLAEARHRNSRRLWWSRIAAVAAIFIVLVAGLTVRAVYRANHPQSVAYIYGNKVEDERLAEDMMCQVMDEIFNRPDVEGELNEIFNSAKHEK